MKEQKAIDLAQAANKELPDYWVARPVLSRLHGTWYVEAEKNNEKYMLYGIDGKRSRMVFQ